MTQKAESQGAEVWQASEVISLKNKGQGFYVEVQREGVRHELEAKFVVGADGVNSIIRKSLFPDFKMKYLRAYEENYQVTSDLDNRYVNVFCSLGSLDANKDFALFGIILKDGLFNIDVTGPMGAHLRELMGQAKNFLAKNYRFDMQQKPVSREGAVAPMIYEELISHSFLPAKGNALLVGDAGGFTMPVSLEGISTSIKSGIIASNSIKKATESGEQVDGIYLADIEPDIICRLKMVYPLLEKIIKAGESDRDSLPKILLEAWVDSIKIY